HRRFVGIEAKDWTISRGGGEKWNDVANHSLAQPGYVGSDRFILRPPKSKAALWHAHLCLFKT
ncbi:hypothetical protein RCCGEPOP_28054, partial [Rhizobium sp. Pop5]